MEARAAAGLGLESLTDRVFHRRESTTQPSHVAKRQEETGEIWGKPARWSDIPKVKAYTGPLPDGQSGIEFVTDVPPDVGSAPGEATWAGPRPGVRIED